jgi:hypothetical protein
MLKRVFTAVAFVAALGCTAPSTDTSSDYLFVWTGAEQEGDSDFLAVIDVDPASPTYAQVLSSVAVGVKGMAHHSEHVMPEGDSLFVNSFKSGDSFVIDLSDPLAPNVASRFRNHGEYTYPHTFERLPNGNVLATFQTKGEGNLRAGGILELDASGNLVRAADAETPVDPELRAYSVKPIPELGIAVSTSSDMNMAYTGRSFQTWTLPDLQPIATVLLPPGPDGDDRNEPSEVRLLADGKTAVMGTFTCALYLLNDLDTDEPWAERISVLPWETWDTDDCGIPFVVGNYWIQTHSWSGGSEILSIDLTDPHNPAIVGQLKGDASWWPHWISGEPGGNRIVLTNVGGAEKYQVMMFTSDPETGTLAWDESFREPGSDLRGVSFDRTSWPHGTAGPGAPHGAVFSRPEGQ